MIIDPVEFTILTRGINITLVLEENLVPIEKLCAHLVDEKRGTDCR